MTNGEFEQKDTLPEASSTIFTASPTKDTNPVKPAKRKMLKSALAAVLAVALLGGVTFGATLLIPKKEEEQTETTSIKVTKIEEKSVETVTLNSKAATTVFRTNIIKSEQEGTADSVEWTVDGIDPALTSSSSISLVTTSILNLDALFEIEPEENGNYGFESPEYTADIKGYDSKDDLLLTVGSLTPSSSGYYVKKSGDTKIYISDRDTIEGFGKSVKEMSNTNALSPAADNTGNSSYFTSGALTTFDSITLSRKGYSDVVIVPNTSEVTKGVCAYLTAAPLKRFADTESAQSAFNVAANGVTSGAVYEYAPSDADIKKYGLNNPENRITVKYGNQTVTIDAVPTEEGSYAALINGEKKAIYKLDASVVPFFAATPDDFVSKTVFAETPDKVTQMRVNDEGEETVIDVVFTDDDPDGIFYYPKCNGKDINGKWYRNFYEYLEKIEPQSVENGTPKLRPSFSVSVTAGGETNEYAFIKSGTRRYRVTRNGVPYGDIASTYYERLVKGYRLLIENKEVPVL